MSTSLASAIDAIDAIGRLARPFVLAFAMLGMTLAAAAPESRPSFGPFTVQSRASLGANDTVLLVGTVEIKSNSESAIKGPLSLVIERLPASATLVDARGHTADGNPFIDLDANFTVQPFETKQIGLRFQVKAPPRGGDTVTFVASLRPVTPPQRDSGKARLMGPDANNNGIRDDLEPLLQSRYGSNPRLRSAAAQVLTAMRQSIGATDSPQQAYASALILNRSFDCMGEILEETSGAEIAIMRDWMINTKDRVRAWIEAFNLLAGTAIEIGVRNPCDNR